MEQLAGYECEQTQIYAPLCLLFLLNDARWYMYVSSGDQSLVNFTGIQMLQVVERPGESLFIPIAFRYMVT